MRNIGGSIGISIVETILARHQQLHQNEMVQHIVQWSPVYQTRVQQYTETFSNYASAPTAHTQAIGQVGRAAGPAGDALVLRR